MNDQGVVQKAFGSERMVTLESGRKLKIPRWSVSKALSLGTTVSSIAQSFFEVVRERGMDDGDVDIASFIVSLPIMMTKSAEDLAKVMESSLTLRGGEKQLTVEQILGTDDDDPNNISLEDFPELLTHIIRMNLTEKLVEKWKALFQSGMGLIPGLTMEEDPPTKKRKTSGSRK